MSPDLDKELTLQNDEPAVNLKTVGSCKFFDITSQHLPGGHMTPP